MQFYKRSISYILEYIREVNLYENPKIMCQKQYANHLGYIIRNYSDVHIQWFMPDKRNEKNDTKQPCVFHKLKSKYMKNVLKSYDIINLGIFRMRHKFKIEYYDKM